MCFSFGGGGKGEPAWMADMREFQRKQDIAHGMKSIDDLFGQFDDGFYNKTRKAYLDYANPQLARQEGDARQQLEFALARSGQGKSTVASKARGDLAFDVGTQRQAIADKAEQAVNDQRNNVVNARQGLVSQLNADANTGAAVSGTISKVGALMAAQPALSPIGELFGNVAKNLSTAAQGEGIVPVGGPAVSGGGSASARLFQRVK